VLVAVLVMAGAPAGAHAAVFYVNTAATTPHNPCTDSTPANACKHVMDAVTQARATIGGDLINIAAGTYPEVVTLTNVDDSGDTLAGAGIPSTGHPGTTIGYPNASSEQAELTLGQFVPPLEPNLTVRDLRVAVADAPSAPDGFVALLISSPNGRVSDVEVDDAHSDPSAGAALLAAVNAGYSSPKALSWSIRFVIWILAITMALEELSVARETVIAAFSIVFGALMLGLAIAFGLGGQQLARDFLERNLGDRRKEKTEEPQPL